MLGIARLRPDDFVIDLGSGDGRILIAAARSNGARGLGVDIDPARIAEAEANARAAGVTGLVTFRREDLFQTPLAEADVLTLYLTQEVNLRLRPRILAQMRAGTRVVSHDFDMGDWRWDERRRVGAANVYLWIVPARVAGDWTLTQGRPQRPARPRAALSAGHRHRRRGADRAGARSPAPHPLHRQSRRGPRIFEGRVEGDTIVPTDPGRLARRPRGLMSRPADWPDLGGDARLGGAEGDRAVLASSMRATAGRQRDVTELGSFPVVMALAAIGALLLIGGADWAACCVACPCPRPGRRAAQALDRPAAAVRPGALLARSILCLSERAYVQCDVVWLGSALLLVREAAPALSPSPPRIARRSGSAELLASLARRVGRRLLAALWPPRGARSDDRAARLRTSSQPRSASAPPLERRLGSPPSGA